MKHYALARPDGTIQQICAVQDEAEAPAIAGLQTLEYDLESTDPRRCYVKGGKLTEFTEQQLAAKAARPNIEVTWSNATMTWVDQRPDAALAEDARAKRDKLLAACDWTQLGDSPMVGASGIAWKAYRAALRDLTRQAGFPRSINWPTPPG